MAPEEKITLHMCVVCKNWGTNEILFVAVDETDAVVGAVCRGCVQKELARKEKENEG